MNTEASLIQGNLVFLRAFTESDITATYLAWLHDKEALRFSNQRFREHSPETCLSYLRSFDHSSNLFLAVISNETQTMVGTMTAYIQEPHSTADMGILIGDRSTWGKGFGSDAWISLLNFLLTERKIRKVTGGTLSGNKGMISIMERSGMHLEGSRKAQEITDGEFQDTLYYAKFRDS
jgi:ribosomal-protein-alanine N-acetyltransferase